VWALAARKQLQSVCLEQQVEEWLAQMSGLPLVSSPSFLPLAPQPKLHSVGLSSSD